MKLINLLAIVVTLNVSAYAETGNPTASGVMPAVGMCAMDKVNGVTVPFWEPCASAGRTGADGDG